MITASWFATTASNDWASASQPLRQPFTTLRVKEGGVNALDAKS